MVFLHSFGLHFLKGLLKKAKAHLINKQKNESDSASQIQFFLWNCGNFIKETVLSSLNSKFDLSAAHTCIKHGTFEAYLRSGKFELWYNWNMLHIQTYHNSNFPLLKYASNVPCFMQVCAALNLTLYARAFGCWIKSKLTSVILCKN